MRTSADHSAEEAATRFVAGHTAPAGTYRLVGMGREVRLDLEDVLPETLDGHIAVYERRPLTWAELQCRGECA